MKNLYLDNQDAFDLRKLRHDLRGLVMPFGIAIEAMSEGEVSEAIELQKEVLLKLRAIVNLLDSADSEIEGRQNVK